MRILLLVISIYAHFLCFGQKIASDKIDDFTGRRTVITSPSSLGGLSYVISSATIDNEDTIYTLGVSRTASITTSTQGSKLHIKFLNGEVLSLIHSGEYDIATRGQMISLFVRLTEDDLKVLLSEPVLKIRMETRNENIDIDVPTKRQNIFRSLLKVMHERVIETK
jgi:hypothetical protein